MATSAPGALVSVTSCHLGSNTLTVNVSTTETSSDLKPSISETPYFEVLSRAYAKVLVAAAHNNTTRYVICIVRRKRKRTPISTNKESTIGALSPFKRTQVQRAASSMTRRYAYAIAVRVNDRKTCFEPSIGESV